jgi:hypothetical protein
MHYLSLGIWIEPMIQPRVIYGIKLILNFCDRNADAYHSRQFLT